MVLGMFLNLPAVEETPDQIGDIRLDVGVVPASRNVQEGVSVAGTTFSGTDSLPGLDIGLRVDLGMYRTLSDMTDGGTVVIGLNVFEAQQSGDSNQNNPRYGALVGPIEMNALGVDLSISYAIALWRGWHVEIGPFVGIGSADITDRALIVGSTTVSESEGGHGVYREFGGRLSLFYTDRDNGLIFHIAIAYYGAHTSANFTYTAASGDLVKESLTIDESGISPSIGFGYRF